MKDRKTGPTAKTTYSNAQRYRVWWRHFNYDEDQTPWKCVAMFSFLQDALDYISASQDRGAVVVFQSPAGIQSYGPTDRRAVQPAAGLAVLT